MRTDLWAVGVILYRLLTGRLPFAGNSQLELLEAIRYAEPQDIRDLDPHIPPELARIVRRCLSKRMSDRHQSAAELADDLRAFVTPHAATASADSVTRDAVVAVVPKGLRCFDANDRDFFLSLVPGPRDRNGVPGAVLFWQRHLQETDPAATFRVGLLYGPSGCGKSSLVRAGILPRLSQSVIPIIVEAVRDETEIALIRELRRRFPDLSTDLALPELLREVREGPYLPPGGKLVIVFDQFEQWLHDWCQDAIAQLTEALRQCDGGRVQAVVLVRDDFWMPATRFFQQLDIRLVEGANACAVDLFDRAHATKVLAAFGVAYGRLDGKLWPTNRDQTRFLECAVDDLAEDGWIVPVRLCIFAEMIKSKAGLRPPCTMLAGEGLGEAFLEEVFNGRSASPMYRLHRKAALQVLERLLPPIGTDIRGHLVSESELRSVSGYDQRPADFAVLLRCLDQELRLITPTEVDAPASSDHLRPEDHESAFRWYQLTHDFLVTAIRGWLNQGRRRTFRGRAELRLADYAEAYSARQETGQLPSWWGWLSILILTRSRQWSAAEQAMMRRAARYHAVRIALVTGTAFLAGFVVYDRMAAVHAEGLVQALATSDSRDVPQAADRLINYRRWTKPRLVKRLEAVPQDQVQRARLLLGLVAVGDPHTTELVERLFDSDPSMAVAIADVLFRHGQVDAVESNLWSTAGDDREPPAKRLRAMAALTRLDPHELPRNGARSPIPHDRCLCAVAEDPGQFRIWVDALSPVRDSLLAPLKSYLANTDEPEADRLLAASILAQYVAADTKQLIELALQSPPKQFEVFTRGIGKRTDVPLAQLLQEAAATIPDTASEDEKDRIARRQANAIVLLRELEDDQVLWPALKFLPDPRLRSYLIDHLQHASVVSEELVRRLSDEDPGTRQAAILVLGSGLSTTAPASGHSTLVESLLQIFRNDPDSGVHAAAEWSLRRLGAGDKFEEALSDLSQLGMRRATDGTLPKAASR